MKYCGRIWHAIHATVLLLKENIIIKLLVSSSKYYLFTFCQRSISRQKKYIYIYLFISILFICISSRLQPISMFRLLKLLDNDFRNAYFGWFCFCLFAVGFSFFESIFNFFVIARTEGIIVNKINNSREKITSKIRANQLFVFYA